MLQNETWYWIIFHTLIELLKKVIAIGDGYKDIEMIKK